MNNAPLVSGNRAGLINRATKHVNDTANGRIANWYRYSSPCIVYLHATAQTIGRTHGNRAHNAVTNLRMPSRFVNKLLQWKLVDATKEMGRFLINSTLGVGGLFDVARQEMGLERQKADFGQTLGVWGVGPGPYLVLPLLPPLTVRDGVGFAADGAMNPLYYYIPFWPDQLGMKAGDTINDRSLNLDLFQGIEESTVDLYSSVRNGYLQRRNRLIKEGR